VADSRGSIFIRLAVVASPKFEIVQNTMIICTYSGSRSSQVIDSGNNRKCICDFLLVITSNYGPIFAPFLRYGDLLAENCLFFLPFCYSVPPLFMFPLELRHKIITRRKLESWGCGKLHDRNFNRLWLNHPCVRPSRQTDGLQHIARYSIIMLSRAKNHLFRPLELITYLRPKVPMVTSSTYSIFYAGIMGYRKAPML